MVRFLVIAVIVVLVVIAFRLGRKTERGHLIDLEPDQARSDKWEATTASGTRAKGSSTRGKDGATAKDDDVIDLTPDDVEEL